MTATPIPLPDLAAMRARSEAATPGPWKVVSGRHGRYVDHEISGLPRGAHGGFFLRDADFIVNARMDVPALLDECNRLRARIADLEADASFLEALRAAGVDHWSGYDLARDLVKETHS